MDEFMIPSRTVMADIFHVRNTTDIIMNALLTFVGGFIGYFIDIVNVNSDAFFSIALVVGVDFIFGILKSFKTNTFETRRALKVVWYFSSYSLLLALMLSIEKGFSYASWMAEAVMLPIITFQIISALKNASIVGVIPQGVLLKILENIDNYKDSVVEKVVEEEYNDVDESIKNNNNGS